jgi:hypothetical protein
MKLRVSYSVRCSAVLLVLLLGCTEEGGPIPTPPGDDEDPSAEQGKDAGGSKRDATVVKDAAAKDATPSEDPDDETDEAPVEPVGQDAALPVVDASSPVDARTTAPDAASDAGTEEPEPPSEDLGKGDGKDVIAIGDSWMNLGTAGIQQSLKKASGQPYRTYGVPGVELLADNLFGAAIPSQYARAKREDPDIKTVVMTGGGNDILMGIGGAKATIDRVAVRLGEIWQEMHDDGVKDVVYIEYSRGGNNKENVEYGISKVMPLCAAAKLRCHWIDSDEFIMMMLRADGIHPTNAGYDALGKAAYELMEREGVRR